MTTITELCSGMFYFLDESGKEMQMTYKLMPKKCSEVKSSVEAETKKNSYFYFAALLHLSANDMLHIYKIC